MKSRTQAAADALDAAATWAPGAADARALATTQHDLLAILGDFEAAVNNADSARWTAARSRYAAWYSASTSSIQRAATDLASLGVTCS